jgi:hypothetical protein
MTQKSGLFKGQQKKDKAANRHGKDVHLRKGKHSCLCFALCQYSDLVKLIFRGF